MIVEGNEANIYMRIELDWELLWPWDNDQDHMTTIYDDF